MYRAYYGTAGLLEPCDCWINHRTPKWEIIGHYAHYLSGLVKKTKHTDLCASAEQCQEDASSRDVHYCSPDTPIKRIRSTDLYNVPGIVLLFAHTRTAVSGTTKIVRWITTEDRRQNGVNDESRNPIDYNLCTYRKMARWTQADGANPHFLLVKLVMKQAWIPWYFFIT